MASERDHEIRSKSQLTEEGLNTKNDEQTIALSGAIDGTQRDEQSNAKASPKANGHAASESESRNEPASTDLNDPSVGDGQANGLEAGKAQISDDVEHKEVESPSDQAKLGENESATKSDPIVSENVERIANGKATSPGSPRSPRRRRHSARKYRSDDSADESDDAREAKPVPKVVHKIEYRHVSSNAVVFEEESDRFAPTKPPPEEPVLEVITIAFTAQDRSPYSHHRHIVKPPPIHSMGHTYILINSAAVVNALRAVVSYYPGQNLIGDSMQIAEPYTILVHHEQELIEFRKSFAPEVKKPDDEHCEIGEDTYEHLGIVLDFLSKTMKDSLEKERARHAREIPVATYENLWLLFRPGTDVYYDTQSCGEFDSYIVKNVSWEINNGAPVRYNIGLWNLYYDSIHIGPRNAYAVVLPFDGEKPIAELDIFPTEYLSKEIHKETPDEMQKRLEERGRMFFRLTSKQCMWYDGSTTTFPRQKFVGTVMVDTESFWTSLSSDKPPPSAKHPAPPPPPLISDDVGERTIGGIPGCFCKRCVELNNRTKKSQFANYARINPMTIKELTPHQYWLCDRSVHGFIMKVRTWHRLDVASFSEPKFDTHLIDDLVLASDTKTLIKSLSKRYAREDAKDEDSDKWAADFVQGKGEGLIFLLHGKPGVGKTYTSECVAHYTRRPLLSLTCTDLGTNPLLIESKLMYWFKLAKHWGAILLIDEADIYMEQRVTRDLDRNHLVNGFLRGIEYYQGILFLTTNRVGVYDEAFLSRIHISIHYPEFSDKDRAEVWASFFRKLESEKAGTMVVSEEARRYIATSPDMRAVKWNGREIRNAFQTAVALAEVEASETPPPKPSPDTSSTSNPPAPAPAPTPTTIILQESHIKSIVRMSAAFKKYLATLHQGDETRRAAREGLRVDDFDESRGREGGEFAHYV